MTNANTPMTHDLIPPPHQLLYLAKSGSHLFGTNTPASDIDVKGIFLPSLESLLLQHAPEHFTRNTNSSSSGQKNAADDIDVTVWSLQFWAKILRKADMNAISLLFSYSNPAAAMPLEGQLQRRFVGALRELDPIKLLSRNLSGMMGYVYSQAMRYSEKGKHYRALGLVLEVFHEARSAKISDLLPEVLARAAAQLGEAAGKMIYVSKSRNNQEQLHILEKVFDLTVTVEWALPPLEALYAQYGKRARAASDAGGIDYKAFSHSLRVLDEIQSLHQTGRIVYPLARADLLRDIKLGRYEQAFLVEMLEQNFAETQAMEAHSVLSEQPDEAYLNDFMVAWYR
jgi:hypothetical protein